MNDTITAAFESARPELRAYLCRFVIRPQVAGVLVQTTYRRCFEASERLPSSTAGYRAWFFKVGTNLATAHVLIAHGFHEAPIEGGDKHPDAGGCLLSATESTHPQSGTADSSGRGGRNFIPWAS